MPPHLLLVVLIALLAGCSPLIYVKNNPVAQPSFEHAEPVRAYQHTAGDIPMFRWDSTKKEWAARDFEYHLPRGQGLSTIPPRFDHPGADDEGNALYRQVCVPPDVWLELLEARKRLPEVEGQVRDLQLWGRSEVERGNDLQRQNIDLFQTAVAQRDEARVVCVILGVTVAGMLVGLGAAAGQSLKP